MLKIPREAFKKHADVVYLCFGLFGVSLLIGSYAITNPQIASTVASIGTNLLSVVTVFFFLEKYSLIGAYDATHQLEQVISRLDRKTSFLRGPEDNPKFDEVIAEAKEIRLLGEAMDRLLRSYESQLEDRLRKGANIDLLFMKPDSEACHLFETINGPDFSARIKDSIERAVKIRNRVTGKGIGKLRIKTINWLPSCSLHIIDPSKETAYVRVTIYALSPDQVVSKRAHFILDKQTDSKWHQSYIEQFDHLWGKGELWQ